MRNQRKLELLNGNGYSRLTCTSVYRAFRVIAAAVSHFDIYMHITFQRHSVTPFPSYIESVSIAEDTGSTLMLMEFDLGV